MTDNRVNNQRDGIKPYIPVLVAIISTFGLTLGGNHLLLNSLTPEAIAPDRFTGTEAKALEQRIAKLEDEVKDLRLDLNKLPPRELTDRVLSLEIQLRRLRQDFDECCKAE